MYVIKLLVELIFYARTRLMSLQSRLFIISFIVFNLNIISFKKTNYLEFNPNLHVWLQLTRHQSESDKKLLKKWKKCPKEKIVPRTTLLRWNEI